MHIHSYLSLMDKCNNICMCTYVYIYEIKLGFLDSPCNKNFHSGIGENS